VLSLSAVKLSSLLLLLPAPYRQCRLGNCLLGRKGIFCKMERTQFTQYILGKVFAPSPPPLPPFPSLFKTCSLLTKNTYPVLTRNLQRRWDSRNSVVQNVCVPSVVVTFRVCQSVRHHTFK